jgi:multiple sugar transport system substrate-binding protein
MIKKVVKIGIIFLILTTVLFAAGQGEQSIGATKQVTLTAMYGAPDWPDLNDKLIEEFMIMNPNIKVEYSPLSVGDFTPFIQARIAANTLPDVITINPDAFGVKLAEEGWLADLKDTKTGKNEIDAVKGPYTTSDGTLFGVPFGYATCFIYYNKSMFAEAGIAESDIPKDWDSFLAINKKLKDAGLVPMIASTAMIANTYFSFAFAQNVIPKDPNWRRKMIDGSFNFESPEVRDVFVKLDQMKDYFQEGALSTDYNTMNQLFVQGKGAMIFMGSWGANSLSDSEANGFETGSFMAPFNDAGGSPAVAVAPETGLAANAKSANIAEAKKFIDWILYDKYADIQKARGSISHLKSTVDIKLPQIILSILPQMQSAKIGGELYFTYLPTVVSADAIAKIWQGMMLGEKNPEQATADMQTLYKQAF